MRFIGGKGLILPHIVDIIASDTTGVNTVSDLFSGSGVVSREMKVQGFSVISNDLLYFSYVVLRGTLPLNRKPLFSKLISVTEKPIKFLNQLDDKHIGDVSVNYFTHKNYSPVSGRMYFSEKNAIKIDRIRSTIEYWKDNELITEDEYFYLLSALLEAIPFISNTAGTYGAYLKHWDPRSLKPLVMKEPVIVKSSGSIRVYNENTNALVRNIEVDLAYYDPPYNTRQYLPNYHILETVARWDSPQLTGKTGLRKYGEEKSDYCNKSKVSFALDDLIKNTISKYILLSYNTEGLLTEEEIREILLRYGKKKTLKVNKVQYKRYKNSQTRTNNNLSELLFFIESDC